MYTKGICCATAIFVIFKLCVEFLQIRIFESIVNYNLIDILTVTVVGFGLYYLAKNNEVERHKKIYAEKIIEQLKEKFNVVCNQNVKTKEVERYLTQFKSIDNKIEHLKIMLGKIECGENIKRIQDIKDNIDCYIKDNLSEGDEYFFHVDRKYKLQNYYVNIENQFDKIINKIYISQSS